MLCVFKYEIAGPFFLFREPAVTSQESRYIGGIMLKGTVRFFLIEIFVAKVLREGFDNNIFWYLAIPRKIQPDFIEIYDFHSMETERIETRQDQGYTYRMIKVTVRSL